MAAVFGPTSGSSTQNRKRPLTYGKTRRNAAYTENGKALLEKRSPAHSKPKVNLPAVPRKDTALVSDEYDVPMSEDEGQLVQPKNEARRQDEFEVPLSEEETPSTKLGTRVGKVQLADRAKSHILPPISPETAASARSLNRPKERGSPMLKKRKRVESSHNAIRPTTGSDQMTDKPKARPSVKGDSTHTSAVRRSKAQPNASQMSPYTPRKGTSAPSLLTRMVTEDSVDDSKSMNPGRPPSPVEMQEAAWDPPETPGRPSASPARLVLSRNTSMTPKQADLWDQLLPAGPGTCTFDTKNTELLLGRRISNPLPTSPAPLSRSMSDTTGTPHKVRLVDRLKQDRRPSLRSEEDELESSESSDIEELTRQPTSQGQKLPLKEASRGSTQSISQSSESVNSGPKLTYARTRSYLQEESFEANLLLSMPVETPERPSTKAKSEFDLDDESDEGQSQGIRSIHELRAAGNRKRFMDDVDILMDDIKDHSKQAWSRRRSALMELTNKITEKAFMDRFVENGYDRNLSLEYKCISRSTGFDIIADSIALVSLIHVSLSDIPKRSVEHLSETGILDWTVKMLGDSSTMFRLAKDRKNNMSKSSQSTFLEFMEEVRTSGMWNGTIPESLTLSTLALKTIDGWITRLRKAGRREPLIVSCRAIEQLAKLAVFHETNHNAATNGTLTRMNEELSLSILEMESVSIDVGDAGQASIWSKHAIEDVANNLPRLIVKEAHSLQRPALAFRLCLNLTNNKAENCDVFASDAIISGILDTIPEGFERVGAAEDDGGRATELDLLLLGLGLMINLAEHSDSVRMCAVTCGRTKLPALVEIFLKGQQSAAEAASMEQSRINVAYGYLAVLLGNLCLNRHVKDVVRPLLPNKSLATLVQAVEEFVQFHQAVDSQAFEGDDGREVWRTFTNRLIAVADRIQDDGN